MQTINRQSSLNIGLANWWLSNVDLVNSRQTNFIAVGPYKYIDCGRLNFPKAITISAWFSGSEGTLVSNYSSDGYAAQYDLTLSPDGAVVFTVQSGQGIYRVWATAIDSFNSDSWYYVQVTHDGNFNVQIIINDRVMPLFYMSSAGVIVPTIPYSAGNTSIGRAGSFNGAYFNGQFRDVRLYNCPILDNHYYYESLLGNPTTLERDSLFLSNDQKGQTYLDNLELDEMIGSEVISTSQRIIYLMAPGHDYQSVLATSTDNQSIRSYTFNLDVANSLNFKLFLNYNRFETFRIMDQGSQYIAYLVNSSSNMQNLDVSNTQLTFTVDFMITLLS